MKAQLTPKNFGRMTVLYNVFMYTDEDTGKVSTEVREFVVRTIAAPRGTKSFRGIKMKHNPTKWVHCVYRTCWSMKGNTFLPYVPNWCKKTFPLGERLCDGLYTTKLAAAKYALHELQTCPYHKDDPDTPKEIKVLKGYISRLKKVNK